MPDNVTQISQALDTDPFEVELGAALPAAGEIDSLLKTHTELADSLHATFEGWESHVSDVRNKRIAEVRGRLGSLVETVPGVGNMGPEKTAISSVMHAEEARVNKDIARLRLGVVDAHKQDVDARLLRLNQAEQKLAAFMRTFPSPIAYLEAQNLSDQKRATYHTTVSHAGPHALLTLARTAIQTNDRALGAAVAARLGELPTDARPFSANALAKALVGKEYDTFAKAYRKVRSIHQTAQNRLSNFRMGKTTPPTQRIAAGLNAQEQQPAGHPAESEVSYGLVHRSR